MTGQFRYTIFDPPLILSQILTIQTCYYFSLCILIYVVNLLFVHQPSLGHLFAYNTIGLTRAFYFSVTICFVINAAVGGVILWQLVGRAKQCLDHSVTLHLIHLICCWIYSGHFPNTLSWWLLQIFSASFMCLLAEFLCVRSEMKAIPLLQAKDDL